MSKKNYNSPSMGIYALKVERGFADSLDPFDYENGTENGDVINGGFGWGI